MNEHDKVIQCLECLELRVTYDDGGMELAFYSSLGEDFHMTIFPKEITFKGIADAIWGYGFNANGHAAEHIANRGAFGTPASVFDLAKDALWIETRINQIELALRRDTYEG